MPDINITVGDAGVIAVANAWQATCHMVEVIIEAQPPELRAEVAKLQIEQLKPIIALAASINRLLGV